jgi:hypothetical protein
LGEPGLANVEVTLKDQFGTPLMTTTTYASGYYLFTGIAAGNNYYVEATSSTIPAGLTQSAATGSNNRTNAFNLTAGQSYTGADLGYKPATGTATIGNYVWSDANADNNRNAGEPGIAGVTVELWRDVNGDGTKDAGDALCDTGTCGVAGTATTAPDGSYLFSGVTASGTQDYIVYIDETALLAAGYVRTSPPNPPSVSALQSIIDIASNAAVLSANFGYQGTTYSITDRVWFDASNYTILDLGEPGISGVTVDLLDASLNAIATTTTAYDGTFTFAGVAGGGADYTIKITDTGGKLTDYFGTTTYAQAGSRQVVNLTGDMDSSSTPSFGYNLSRAIGDTVFNDNGAGTGGILGDGIQNGSEPGIPGVTVQLYLDDGDGSFEPGTGAGNDGNSVSSLVTDANGRYIFSGLANGTYWVHIDNTQAGLSSFTLTTADASAVAGHQRLVTMSGSTDIGIDFDYRTSTPRNVSGVLWEDNNSDSVIDSGEAGIPGVTIDLLNAGGIVVATTTTSAYGDYSFAGVQGGTYTVRITDTTGVLSGYTQTYEYDGTLNGEVSNIDVSSVDATRDFGFFKPIPTQVILSHFGVFERNGQMIVRWETASETNTLGFNLFRLDPATGEYKQVNSGLLPAMHKPHRGGKYSIKDAGASPGNTYTYNLVEVEVHGGQISYGPFTVFAGKKTDNKYQDLSDNSDYVRTERDRPEMHKARMEGRKVKQENNDRSARGNRIKITVTENGIYYMDGQDISSMLGIPRRTVSSMIGRGQLSLSNQGRQVAYLPADNNAGLYFYGTRIDSIYTKENVYWVDKGRGTLMTVLHGTGPEPSPEMGSFTETVHFEEDIISWDTLFYDPDADYWFWKQIFASKGYTGPPASFIFQPLGLAPENTTATVQINLFGGSDAGIAKDHHVIVSMKEQKIDDWWSGITPHTITSEFSLAAGDNTITVTGKADEGVPSSFIMIDSFDVTYQRLYAAIGDALFFKGNGSQSVTIGGFLSPDIMVFDLTDALRPKLDEAISIVASSESVTTGYSVSLNPVSVNNSYLAVAAGGIKTASARAAAFSNLFSKKNAANYIVIAPAEFVSTAQDLANYRRSQGMKTMVVNLEDVMNEFNYGISSPEAIKSFLSFAYLKWGKALRYVVLAGDGSSDYRNNGGFGGNLIPSKMVPTDFGLAMSDNYLADVNGDHLPEFAIGRLPVVNVGELQTVINKIKTHERNLGSTTAVLVADTPDDGGKFILESEAVAGLISSYAYNVNRIHLDNPAMVDVKRADLINAINQGAAFINYVGHAAPDQLSNWGLLSYYPYPEYDPPDDDLSLLTNANILPVMTAMTCGLNNFSDPYQDVLGEALLLKSDGGVSAAWSATGLSDDAQATILNLEFYKAVFAGTKAVLGDAVLKALSVYKNQGTMPFMMDIYCILGDPALRLR